MKKTKISSFALLALACALIICAFAGVVTSADGETAPVAEIDIANVAYNDMVQLAFTVKTTDALPEGAVVGIMTWAADAAEFTPATASYYTFESSEKDGKVYFKTLGIPAPEMDNPIYVAAIYKEGDVITVAETPFKYSALQYAGKRLTEFDVTANQAALYEDLIKYGMRSDVIFENSQNYAFVKTVNGTVGSAGAVIGGWAGLEVLLRAEAKNADDEYFLYWQNEEGEQISTSRLAYVTAPESGIDVYTAVFGDKASSAYSTTYNFEALTTGELTASPSGMAISGHANGSNAFYVTESFNGDKQFLIDRIVKGGTSYVVKFTLPSKNINALEYDFEFTEAIADDVLNNFVLNIKNGAGQSTKIRVNHDYVIEATQFFIYMEGSWAAFKGTDGNTAYIDCPKGSTVTLKYVLDTDNIRTVSTQCYRYSKDADGNYLDKNGNIVASASKAARVEDSVRDVNTCDLLIYANGKYLGKADLLKCTATGYFQKAATLVNDDGNLAFVLDESTRLVTEFSVVSLSAASKDISLDNFTYFVK